MDFKSDPSDTRQRWHISFRYGWYISKCYRWYISFRYAWHISLRCGWHIDSAAITCWPNSKCFPLPVDTDWPHKKKFGFS